jgi:hypothetical protein
MFRRGEAPSWALKRIPQQQQHDVPGIGPTSPAPQTSTRPARQPAPQARYGRRGNSSNGGDGTALAPRRVNGYEKGPAKKVQGRHPQPQRRQELSAGRGDGGSAAQVKHPPSTRASESHPPSSGHYATGQYAGGQYQLNGRATQGDGSGSFKKQPITMGSLNQVRPYPWTAAH